VAAVELFADQPSTVVSSGGTTNSDTSFTVASPSLFPQASNSATPPTQFHIVDANPAKQSEIMTVTNVSGSTWSPVTRGAEGTTAVAHNPGWTAVQVVTSGWLGAVSGQYFGYPWQFYPENFGAVGDGKIISDAVLASNTTLTSATANFTSADTGKHIMINGGAGTTSGPLVTTITFSNSTTVTLGSAASVSGSNFVAVYGTDDTTAIQNAVTAAGNYATAHNYFAEVVFGAKIYVLSSGPTQSGNGSTTPTFNAQVSLPYPNANGTTQKMVIQLTGAGDAGFYEYWESTTPNAAGSVLMSMTTAPSTPSGTFGNQSVIGGPAGAAGYTGGFANVKPSIRGLQVMCGAYTNQYAFDLGYVSAMRIQSSSAHIFAPAGLNGGNSPLLKDLPAQGGFQATIGAGLRSPVIANNADIYADDFTVEGYARGLYVFDHFTAPKISTIYNDVALKVDLTQGLSGVSHGIFIGLLGCEVYNGGISVSGGGGSYVPLYINMDAECGSVTYDISASGVAYGVVHWTDPADTRAPVVSGAANLKIINDKLGPGQWTGGMTPAVPSVPLTTVAQVNTAYRDATVYITSGGAAVTVIAVDAVTTGLTLGTTGTVAVRVPSGHSITLTYASTAPTWVWVLD
jgi:hypothetical protein